MTSEATKKIYNFNDSIKQGEEGERIVKEWLESRPNIHKVVDMAKNSLFYHKDVDFVVEKETREKFRLEVKTDFYTSGNIYYETVSNEKYNVDGCMDKTDADVLAYYFIKLDILYLLNMKEYRKLMNKLIEEKHPAMCQKEVGNYAKDGKNTYKSIGYTLPLAVLEEMMLPGTLKKVEGIQKKD